MEPNTSQQHRLPGLDFLIRTVPFSPTLKVGVSEKHDLLLLSELSSWEGWQKHGWLGGGHCALLVTECPGDQVVHCVLRMLTLDDLGTENHVNFLKCPHYLANCSKTIWERELFGRLLKNKCSTLKKK